MTFLRILCGLGLILLGGCSTVPRQEDVTGEPTSAIVQKIRCEAGEALQDLTIALLRSPTFGATDQTIELARQISVGDLKGTNLILPQYRSVLTKQQSAIFEAFTLSAVTFDFRFNINELNNNGGTLVAAYPFSVGGAFPLTLGAHANFQRQTEKKFQITNTFFSLHKEYDDGACIYYRPGPENIIFPIKGSIGVIDVFREYINIDLMRTIYKEESRYNDLLTFTTTHGASANPGLELARVANRFRLTDGTNALLSAERTDIHEVNIEIVRADLKGTTFSKALVQAARDGAARQSLANANRTRTEDLFIIPGRTTRAFLTR